MNIVINNYLIKNTKKIGISEKFENEWNLAYENLINKFNSSKKDLKI